MTFNPLTTSIGRLLSFSLAICTISLATLVAAPKEQPLPYQGYTTEKLFSFDSVLAIASPPGSDNELFLAERDGRILVVSDLAEKTVEPTPFLDISTRVTTALENGLLGIAFHPAYESNGYIYVFYTTKASGQPTDRLSRFTRSTSNPFRADPDSELILIDQHDRATNHNGGDLHFGPDGYLFVSLGDEGAGNDRFENGQRIDRNFFAGIIRIDVDKRPASIEPTLHPSITLDSQDRAPFSIPADNPLVATWKDEGAKPNSPLRLEYYAIGLRNPWRFTIDPLNGDLWVADVGQNGYEEIDIIKKGGNYGWPNREAKHKGPDQRFVPPEFGELIDPVFEYGRSLGNSVTGGIVYRGSDLPELYGSYLFSDFFSNRLWATRKSNTDEGFETTEIGSIPSATAYGVDPRDGELLAATIQGDILKLVRTDDVSLAKSR